MRAAQQVMADLAATALSPEQQALLMELAAAVATEARPIEDRTAQRRRTKDREYQRERRQNRPISADEPPKEEIKPLVSVPNGTGGEPPNPVKELFDLGVGILTTQGHSEKRARSLIGKWRQGRNDGDVAAALLEARTRSISNLVEWMPKRLSATGPPKPFFKTVGEDRLAGASQ